MGLDLFAHNVDPKKFADMPPILCGSMFTDGQSSIRGKVYADFIDEVCDVSIYQQKLKTNDLQRIITQLSLYCMNMEDLFNGDELDTIHAKHGFSLDEIKALLLWFERVKENNGQVIGWW